MTRRVGGRGWDGRAAGRLQAVRVGRTELPLDSPVLAQVAAADRAEYLAQRAALAPLPPAAERGPMTEAVWQAQIVRLAQRLGFYVYHPKLSRWSEQGWPDLSLLGRRALWIECKTDAGQLTPAQCEVIVLMRHAGLEVHVLRPWHGIDAVAAILQAAA